jgi:hypothetical protein
VSEPNPPSLVRDRLEERFGVIEPAEAIQRLAPLPLLKVVGRRKRFVGFEGAPEVQFLRTGRGRMEHDFRIARAALIVMHQERRGFGHFGQHASDPVRRMAHQSPDEALKRLIALRHVGGRTVEGLFEEQLLVRRQELGSPVCTMTIEQIAQCQHGRGGDACVTAAGVDDLRGQLPRLGLPFRPPCDDPSELQFGGRLRTDRFSAADGEKQTLG